MKCPNCKCEINSSCRFCPACGKEVSSSGQNTPEQASPPYMGRQEMPMKWYKFVIYGQLFLTILAALGTAGNFLTGLQYGDLTDQVYAYYRGLKAVDILMGIISLGQIPLAVLARQSLAHFKENGPRLYYAVWIYSIVGNVIYIIGLAAVGAVGTGVSSVAGQIAGAAVMLGVNVMYFKKRMHLFVN